MQILQVIPFQSTGEIFDYLAPPSLQDRYLIGCRVVVPFKTKLLVGIVVGQPSGSRCATERLKLIAQLIDEKPLLPKQLWQCLQWGARFYLYPFGRLLKAILPQYIQAGEDPPLQAARVIWALNPAPLSTAHSLRTTKQQQAVQALQAGARSSAELQLQGIKRLTLQQLYKKQVVLRQAENPQDEDPLTAPPPDREALDQQVKRLEHDQRTCYQRLLETLSLGARSYLLEGVTGSGKTEIYLTLALHTLSKGQQVLILVPEIGLIHPLMARVQAVCGSRIEMLHSGLSLKKRAKIWHRVQNGSISLIVGTRSAIFLPFSDLGLIVVDEEHDLSYKQQEKFRYHARDLAVYRAKQASALLILGSATPALETLYNVEQGRYQHLLLRQRAQGASLPTAYLLDLKNLPIEQGLSKPLLQRMAEHLAQNQQILLLINRRGYAPRLFCHACGNIALCPDCEKPYTLHDKGARLSCHRCHAEKQRRSHCDRCQSTLLVAVGLGTERVEEILTKKFPNTMIYRFDRETTSKQGSFQGLIDQVKREKPCILIGTQMLAKGHNFPNLTLVAMIEADSALFSLDIRAEERFAQLYTQVSGRAGRAHAPGEVIVQTYQPQHPLWQRLAESGYSAYATQLLAIRKAFELFPITRTTLLCAESVHPEFARAFLNRLLTQLETAPNNATIQGPIPHWVHKKAGKFCWHLLLKHPSSQVLHRWLYPIWISLQKQRINPKKLRWWFDVDPTEGG